MLYCCNVSCSDVDDDGMDDEEVDWEDGAEDLLIDRGK